LGRRAAEIGIRLALAWVAMHWLPHVFTNDVHTLWVRTKTMGVHRLPYRQVLWEYPPLSLIPVLWAPALARHFEVFRWSFVGVMVAAEYGSLEILRRAHPESARSLGHYWHLVVLPLGLFTWFRLDFLAVFCAVVALEELRAGRTAVGAITAGVFTKLWPGVLAVVLVLRRQWRSLIVLAAVDAVLLAAWVAYSPTGFRAFLRYREGRGFQVESLIGSIMLASGSRPRVVSLTWVVGSAHATAVGNLLLLVWVLLVAGSVAVAGRREPDLVALVGGLVLGLIVTSRLLSPQFLVWVVPFVAIGWAAGQRRPGYLLLVASAISVVTMRFYGTFVHHSRVLQLGVVGRDLILVALTADLIARGVGPRSERGPDLSYGVAASSLPVGRGG
jgi:hypothetical protein